MPVIVDPENLAPVDMTPADYVPQLIPQPAQVRPTGLSSLPSELLALIGKALLSQTRGPTASFLAFRLTSYKIAEATLFPLTEQLTGAISPSRSSRWCPDEQLRLHMGASRLLPKVWRFFLMRSPFALIPMSNRLAEFRLPCLRYVILQQLCFDGGPDIVIKFLEAHQDILSTIIIADCTILVKDSIHDLRIRLSQSGLIAPRSCNDTCTALTVTRITQMLWLPLLKCLRDMPDTRFAQQYPGNLNFLIYGLRCHYQPSGPGAWQYKGRLTDQLSWLGDSCACLERESEARDYAFTGERAWQARSKEDVALYLERHLAESDADHEGEPDLS